MSTQGGSVTPFAFEDHLVRIVTHRGEPWFVVSDVCRVLGLAQPASVVRNLDDDEKGLHSTHTPGGGQNSLIVSEAGLYAIVLRSRAATTPGSIAHRFRKWVTGEVLPQLRRAGCYHMPESGAPSSPAARATILPGHPDFSQAVRLVREARLSRGCDAALSVWREVGLPWVPELETAPAVPMAPGEDAVSRFAVEGLERAPGVMTPGAALYHAYRSFCIRHGLANTGEASFFTRFARMGFTKRRLKGRYVYLDVKPVGVELPGEAA